MSWATCSDLWPRSRLVFVIYFGGPVIVDPILSIFVSALILHSSWGVVKTSVHLLLDGVPDNIPYQEVGSTLEAIPGVYAVHDLHIWDMTANEGGSFLSYCFRADG